MKNCDIEILDPLFKELVGSKFDIKELFKNAIWAEGPAFCKETETLIFSDVKANTMYRFTEKTGVKIYRKPSNFSNGNAFDKEGNLFTCSHGKRGIEVTAKGQEISQIIVDKIDGKRLNSPNDLVIKSDGTIWFTDPPYGILSDSEGFKSSSEVIGCYVYCFEPKSKKLNIATLDVMRPNGLYFSPDEKQLIVADMSIVEFPEIGFHHLVAFDVENNFLKNRRVIAEINPGIPDGFCISDKGVIFCSCGNGLIFLTLEGKILGRLNLGKETSNVTFGHDQNTLFITASNSLYKLQLT